MAFRFEFDSANRILLLRVDGRLTDELLGELLQSDSEVFDRDRCQSWHSRLLIGYRVCRLQRNYPPVCASGTSHAGCQSTSYCRGPADTCIWSISHVSAHERGFTATSDDRTHDGRGVCSTRRSIPTV